MIDENPQLKEATTAGIRITLLKNQGEGHYQKGRYPTVHNTFQVLNLSSPEELLQVFNSLLTRTKWCHISGFPTEEALEQLDKIGGPNSKDDLRIPRNKSMFSHFNTETNASHESRLMCIDFDISGKLTTYLTKEYSRAYTEGLLTEDIILSQAGSLLANVFDLTPDEISDYCFIIRKSTSFGLSSTPTFKAHVYPIFDSPVSMDVFKAISDSHDAIDSHTYSTGAFLLYTCVPAASDKYLGTHVVDTTKPLARITLSPGPTFFRSAPITSHFREMTTPSKGTPEHGHLTSKRFRSSNLSGYKGAVNRSAASPDSHFNIERGLESLGYEAESVQKKNQIRYRSPNASSATNLGGCIYYTDTGYVYDHHSNSPLAELCGSKPRLHAYQLYLAIAKRHGTERSFHQKVKDILHEDIKHVEEERTLLEMQFEWIPSVSTDTMQHEHYLAIVDSVLHNIHYAAIPARTKQLLRDKILQKPYEPPKGVKRLNKSKITEMNRAIMRDSAQAADKYSPSCAEGYNANLFLKDFPIKVGPQHSYLQVPGYEHPYPDLLPWNGSIREGSESFQRLYSRVSQVLGEDEIWSRAKKLSINKEIFSTIYEYIYNPGYKPIPIDQSLYRFNDTSYNAVNVKTGQVESLGANQTSIYVAPFDEKTYLANYQKPIEGTAFYDRLLDAYDGNLERVQTVRDLFTCALTPDKPDGVIFSLYGQPRSMKSTIMRLIRQLLPHHVYTMDLAKLGGDFALGTINEFYQVLEITEFNPGKSHGSRFNQGINELLSLSGRDGLTVNAKNVQQYRIDFMPCICITGNDPPAVPNTPAWFDRIFAVHHEKSFRDEARDGGKQFWTSVSSTPVELFTWAITNPNYSNGILVPSFGAIQKEDHREFKKESDLIAFLIDEHLVSAAGDSLPKVELTEVFRKLAKHHIDSIPRFMEGDNFVTLNKLKEKFPLITRVAALNNTIIEQSEARYKTQEDLGRTRFVGIAWKDFEEEIRPILTSFKPTDGEFLT